MPSEGSFAASGPRRHGEPPARRPRGVGARWHQGHFDSCPVFWGHLPGAFWFLPGSCRPRLGSPPPGRGRGRCPVHQGPFEASKARPGESTSLPGPQTPASQRVGFPSSRTLCSLAGRLLVAFCFSSSLGKEQDASLPLFPGAPAAKPEAEWRDPRRMHLVPIRRWLGGSRSGTASGPSSLSTYFWIYSSFNGQNLFWNHFPRLAPLGEVGVCPWTPRPGGLVWRPGLCLDGRSLITGTPPPQTLGDSGSPPACCREMKGFAESFELRGETH